jgi:hypothetical protein
LRGRQRFQLHNGMAMRDDARSLQASLPPVAVAVLPFASAKITQELLLLGTVLSPVVSYTHQRHHRDTLSSCERPREGGAMPVYQIRIKKQLGQHWSDWFDGLTMISEANGETVLTGEGSGRVARSVEKSA